MSPAASATVKDAIAVAAGQPSNDSATNPSAPFAVLQNAGVAAVSIKNGVPVVNFSAFDAGKVVTGLKITNVSFALAKVVPAAGGNPDQWVNYVTNVKSAGTSKGPGGVAAVLATANRASTDPKPCTDAACSTNAQLTWNADGYYTYAFTAKVTDPAWSATVQTSATASGTYKTNGVVFEAGKQHRVAIQLSYVNSAGETVRVNPYFDVTFDASGNSVPVATPIRKMVDIGTCNNCHNKLTMHGGNRVDTQYCVMCHNPGSTDVVSGNVVTFSNMIHSIHAGKRLAAAGKDYYIGSGSFGEVGFPQDLRNCTTCHSGSTVKMGANSVIATPQGDNWKTQPSRQACLSCHLGGAGTDWNIRHTQFNDNKDPNAAATLLKDSECVGCHVGGTALGVDRVHFNQIQANAAKYKVNILASTYDAVARAVTVRYNVTDPTAGNAAYNLITSDCTGTGASLACGGTTKFGNLRFYVGYQNLIGQPGPTEWTSYNNGGSGANAYLYKGTPDASNTYTVSIPIPADVAGVSSAAGSARVISIGQVKEQPLLLMSGVEPRPVVSTATADLLNVAVQHTSADFALSGTLQPRRQIVSTDKCNVCHAMLGTASASNTFVNTTAGSLGANAWNAFHNGARNTVEACPVCHDPNRASTGNLMTSGSSLYESFQFKRYIHGLHGGIKRTYPFMHGNVVQGIFGKDGTMLTAGIYPNAVTVTVSGVVKTAVAAGTSVAAGTTLASIVSQLNTAKVAVGGTANTAIDNYTAEVQWPDTAGISCNACHVNDSYKADRSVVGTMVSVPTGITDPLKWVVLTPKAATCTSCHDGGTNAVVGSVIGHVTQWGGAAFGTLTQSQSWLVKETCDDCHASGAGFKAVDIVHGAK